MEGFKNMTLGNISKTFSASSGWIQDASDGKRYPFKLLIVAAKASM
jgi:hypothetical protein